MRKFSLRILRTQGNFLSVYGEYGEFRVVCGTQNLLRIRGKNLCVHREDVKRYKTVYWYFSVNNNTNFKFFWFLSFFIIWDGLSLKPSHATVPLKTIAMSPIFNIYFF